MTSLRPCRASINLPSLFLPIASTLFILLWQHCNLLSWSMHFWSYSPFLQEAPLFLHFLCISYDFLGLIQLSLSLDCLNFVSLLPIIMKQNPFTIVILVYKCWHCSYLGYKCLQVLTLQVLFDYLPPSRRAWWKQTSYLFYSKSWPDS